MANNWTQPATYNTGQLITAADLNLVRDNLEFLKSPPFASYMVNTGGNYTTTSTSFVNVDATNFALTITTAGGPVLIGFYGSFTISVATSQIFLDVEVDGVRMGGTNGLLTFIPYNDVTAASFIVWKTGLSAGSHTFKLQWYMEVGGGTATLYAGPSATAGYRVYPQFWVREVS